MKNGKSKKFIFLLSMAVVLIFTVGASKYGTQYQDMAPGSDLQETQKTEII